jgi:hypothetical protein
MDAISNFQAIAIRMWLMIALLGAGCDSSPDLLKPIEEYPIIITAEDTNRDRLDERFAEFMATYSFLRNVERDPLLGTLRRFKQDNEAQPNESGDPIRLRPTRQKWSETELIEGAYQFLVEWQELLGLDPATLVDAEISYGGGSFKGAGYYYIRFKQRIDSYLIARTSGLGVTDDGLLWNINCRFLPNVALPRVKESPSSSTLKKVRKQLIGRTFTTHGFCGGELAVTPNTSIKFKDVKLYVPKKPDTQNLIKIRIYYRFTMQNPDNPLVWRATFDAVTGEYIGVGYDFGCR